MTQQQIETSVQQFVAEKFMFGQGADKLTKDTSFLDLGVIDSQVPSNAQGTMTMSLNRSASASEIRRPVTAKRARRV